MSEARWNDLVLSTRGLFKNRIAYYDDGEGNDAIIYLDPQFTSACFEVRKHNFRPATEKDVAKRAWELNQKLAALMEDPKLADTILDAFEYAMLMSGKGIRQP